MSYSIILSLDCIVPSLVPTCSPGWKRLGIGEKWEKNRAGKLPGLWARDDTPPRRLEVMAMQTHGPAGMMGPGMTYFHKSIAITVHHTTPTYIKYSYLLWIMDHSYSNQHATDE